MKWLPCKALCMMRAAVSTASMSSTGLDSARTVWSTRSCPSSFSAGRGRW
jgi:hypothetical protein